MSEAKSEVKAKLVKVRILRDTMVNGTIHTPGAVVEVTEDVAKTLCEKGAPGYHPFYGYMPEMGGGLFQGANPLARANLKKAERVA